MARKIDKEKLRNLAEVYRRNIEKELGTKIPEKKIESQEYQEFKKQFMPPHLTLYEKLCNLSGKILKVKPDKKYEPILQESINISHLNVTPSGTTSLSYLAPICIILFGSLISYAIFNSMFFIFFFFLTGILLL